MTPRSAGVTGSPKSLPDVSQDRLGHNVAAVEAELDRAIAELMVREQQAYQDGDPQGARLYLQRATELIRSRAPEHQARLHAEVERRIDEGLDYFQHRARLDGEALRGG